MRMPVIAVVGLGKMGETIIHHIKRTGHKLLIAIEINIDRGRDVLAKAGIKYRLASDIEEAHKILDEGETILTDCLDLALDIEDINVIIDATGNIDVGAYIAWKGIAKKKNIVMLNAELDATIGPVLASIARSSGIVYTGDLGDEPGTIMHYLYEPLSRIGLDVIVAGKGKNNPLNPYATPSDLLEMSKKENLNPRILTSFIDGTKTMIEMTILSNATGLLPDIRGMHGPSSDLANLTRLYRLKTDGGILNQLHVVDYVIGIAPGVFVIATIDDDVIMSNLKYLKVGEGPNFLFYRPYHLPGSETLLSAVRAVVENKPVIQAMGYYSETVAAAKRDLSVGEKIDGIGGYTVYGLIEKRDISSSTGMLPIGLAEGATLKRSIRKDEILTLDDVEIPNKLVYDLWRIQQKICK